MKRLGFIITALLITLPLVLTACAEGGYEGYNTTTPGAIPSPMAPMEPGKEYYDEESWQSDATGEPAVPTERMIIRNADMSLVVEDVTETRDEIETLAANLGGWVVESNIYGEEEEMRGWVSIRVPSSKFEQALSELRALAVRVSSESTSTQDITEEYVDLESRLRNAEATESQYLSLLDTAEEVEDILTIYEALSRIRYEIEQIKGRMQYLEQLSAMSLISINLTPEVSLGPLVRPGWSASESGCSSAFQRTTLGILAAPGRNKGHANDSRDVARGLRSGRRSDAGRRSRTRRGEGSLGGGPGRHLGRHRGARRPDAAVCSGAGAG